MFESLKRKVVFAKLASILEKLRHRLEGQPSKGKGGEVLGWTMEKWKMWLESGLVAAIGGALGAMLQKLGEYQTCISQVPPVPCDIDLHGVGVAVCIGAVTAVVGWLRMSPWDPRRTEPTNK